MLLSCSPPLPPPPSSLTQPLNTVSPSVCFLPNVGSFDAVAHLPLLLPALRSAAEHPFVDTGSHH